jgi:hypothetical protein
MKAFALAVLVLAASVAVTNAQRKDFDLPKLPGLPDEKRDLPKLPLDAPQNIVIDISQLKKPAESPAPKVNADYLAKAFNLKVTSTKRAPNALIVTLEFTKDIEDLSKISEIFRLFDESAKSKDKDDAARLPDFYAFLFDKENVALSKTTISRVEGIITGVSGDAFRIHINMGEQAEGLVTKVDFRPRVRQNVPLQGGVSTSHDPIPVFRSPPGFPTPTPNIPLPAPINKTEPERK